MLLPGAEANAPPVPDEVASRKWRMMSDQRADPKGDARTHRRARPQELRKSAELPKENPMTIHTRNIIGRAGVLLALCASLLASGCSSTFGLPPAPQRAAAEDKAQGYQIGALDELSVVVWRNPDLSATVTVRPDGKISLPLVENLPAAGNCEDCGGSPLKTPWFTFTRVCSVVRGLLETVALPATALVTGRE